MKEAKPAAFNFINYKITSINYNEPQGVSITDIDNVTVSFTPSGKYHKKDSKFILLFDCAVLYGLEKRALLSITVEATFKFNEQLEKSNIPEFFYRNSIAIVFPYVRAFITSITAQSN